MLVALTNLIPLFFEEKDTHATASDAALQDDNGKCL